MFLFLHICAGIRIQMVNLTGLCWSQPQSWQISSFQCKHTAADNSWLIRFYTSSYQISHVACCLSCYYSYYASAILFATHFNKHSDIISVIYSHWSALSAFGFPWKHMEGEQANRDLRLEHCGHEKLSSFYIDNQRSHHLLTIRPFKTFTFSSRYAWNKVCCFTLHIGKRASCHYLSHIHGMSLRAAFFII